MFISYTAVALSLVCVGVAAFVLYKKRSDQLARYFSAYILGVAFWIGSNAMADFAITDFTIRFWSGMSLITGIGYISFYLIFIESFITEAPVPRKRQLLFLTPTLLFSLVAFTPLYVVETFVIPGQPSQILAGPVYYFVFAFTFAGLPYGLWRLIRAYPKATLQKKKQIFYIAAGFSLVLLGMIIFTVALPLWIKDFRFYSLGSEFAIFTILTTGYAMYRHRLLDINLVIQLGLLYTHIVVGLVAIYIFILFILLDIIESNDRISYFVSALITTIFGVFTTPIFERKFRTFTDPYFFKEKYDFSEAIHELSNIVSHYNKIEDIVRNTGLCLQSTFRSEKIVFALLPDYTQAVSEIVPGLSSLIPEALSNDEYIEKISKSVTEFFPLIITIVIEDRCIGAILVGRKKSGEDYCPEDKRLLETFCKQAAVGFKKALLYQEVLDYSQNLSRKVAERTEEVKALHEKQTQMMLDISHELQTPLTVMKGEFDRIRNEFPTNGSLGTFEKSIDRISRFIQAMLRLAKLDAAETTIKKRINLSLLVNEVVEYVTILALSQNITLSAEVEPDIFVWGNHGQLEQLVTNILSNAIKYIANERKVHVTVHVSGNQIKLEISDSGIGINQEQIPKLFQRFYRIPTENTLQGTGLGLAICEKIVKNHSGVIMIASEPGHGTRVTVTLAKID